MAVPPITYAQLLETNNLIQQNADECYYLCVFRTVQESKLFPVPSYMMLSYVNCFYRYPGLLRKIEEHMSAEEAGDRARISGMKITAPVMEWGLANFYLLGREWLINLGMIRPEDAVEDVVYVLDFWKRFQLAWHRNNAHLIAVQAGHRSQIFGEAQLQVFHADLYDCVEGDELHGAAQSFLATVSQYTFLVSCESRCGLNNHGPYKLGEDRELLVRDFLDLAESSYPWLDGVAAAVPYNNLTVPMATKGLHFNWIDDWGSFDSVPEFQGHHLTGVGLYTSDPLTDGMSPVGMGSREELIRTFRELDAVIKDAMGKLWQRFASYSRDQLMDAGAIVYYATLKDVAHIAGCYDPADWVHIDPRADRLRPLLNDEFGRDVLGELVGYISNPSQRLTDYAMMMHSNKPSRVYSLIPYSILETGDYTKSVGGVEPGMSYIPPKADRYRTSHGVFGIDELNARARAFRPKEISGAYRYLCDTWIKYNSHTPLANDYYKHVQTTSRNLKGKGAGLSRADIETLRK